MDSVNPHYHPNKGVLTLAFFFRTSWPGPEDLDKREARSAILMNPTITHVQKNYPVPAHLFEDYHQENFWAVGVRKFGSRILAERSLQQCGHLERFDPEKSYLISKGLLLDVQNLMERSKLLMLGILERMGPTARKGFELGRRLYEIAGLSRRYLLPEHDRREQMDVIQRGIQDLHDATDPQNSDWFIMTTEERDTFFPTQVRFLHLASSEHEHVVDDLYALEEQVNTDRDPYEARRKTLLTFNRQIRIYSRRLRDLLCSRGHLFLGNCLKPIELQLEHSFMTLWFDPDCAWCGTPEDNQEYAIMKQVARSLKKNDSELPQHLQRLANVAGVSRVGLAIIKICHGSPRVRMDSVSSRYDDVKSGLEDLDEIKNEAPKKCLQSWWRNYIHGWLDKGKRLQVKLLVDVWSEEEANLADDEDEDVEMT